MRHDETTEPAAVQIRIRRIYEEDEPIVVREKKPIDKTSEFTFTDGVCVAILLSVLVLALMGGIALYRQLT